MTTLATIRAAVRAHNDDLNRREVVPGVDDYNALLSIIMSDAPADPVRDAASDILATLKSAERMLKHYVGEPPPCRDPIDAARRPVLHAAWSSIERVRAAIAQAEGRAHG